MSGLDSNVISKKMFISQHRLVRRRVNKHYIYHYLSLQSQIFKGLFTLCIYTIAETVFIPSQETKHLGFWNMVNILQLRTPIQIDDTYYMTAEYLASNQHVSICK